MESPSEAGKMGAAVSEVGEASNDVALTGLAIDYHIREAQKNVDAIAAQNDYAVADAQYQTALSKTTDSRAVADVTKQAQDNLNEIAKRWEKSPALVEIQQAGDALRPRIDHMGQVKTVDLMGKEWDVQTDIQLQTLIPQLVTAQRNGDKAQTDYIHGYIDNIFENGKKSGLITEADKELALNKTQIQFRKQLNESYISSADAKERLGAIQQLKSGGSGPLDLSGLAPGDVAALRVHAEETNRTINNLTEAQDLNKNLNVVQNAFQAPEFKNNYEARINALQDGDWLTKHGVVAQDGSPDRVMAEKLIAETNRQRGEWEKERSDRDDKVAEKLAPLIDENKLSLPQLNKELDSMGQTISPRVRAQLVGKWRANLNENIRIRNESYQVQREMKADRSSEAEADFTLRMSRGEIPSLSEIYSAPGLSKADQSTVIARLNKVKEDKPYAGGMGIIASAYPDKGKNLTPAQASLNNQYYLRTMQAYDQYINAHPDEDKSKIAQTLVMPGIVRNTILDSVKTIIPAQPSLFNRMLNEAHKEVEFVRGESKPDSPVQGTAPVAPKTVAAPARPANVPDGYTFDAHGAKGAGWYAPTAK